MHDSPARAPLAAEFVRRLEGRELRLESEDWLRARIAGARSVVLDLGAGDARRALRRARREPDALIVALDATPARMQPQAIRATRARERGGAANLCCLVADAGEIPRALDAVVDELAIVLPWAGLLRALLNGEPALFATLARALAPGGRLEIAINLEPLGERRPRELADLGPLGGAEVAARLA
ncbi:MAG: hypothetical protein ACREM2_12070, partial [Vulcanimicrobiaceae bacterium]